MVAPTTPSPQIIFPILPSPPASHPFGTNPAAAVVIPAGFDPGPPLDIEVYFRGWGNCVRNIVGDSDTACHSGGPRRHASHLATQFASAIHGTGRNAILIVPELLIEAQSGNAGTFAARGGFRTFLDALLTGPLASIVGPGGVARVGRVGVTSHSGGYVASAAVLRSGDLPVHRVALLDSLYGESATLEAWIRGGGDRRLVVIYTRDGGTKATSLALDAKLKRPPALPGGVIDLAAGVTVVPPGVAAVFAFSPLSHTEVSRKWPERVWRMG